MRTIRYSIALELIFVAEILGSEVAVMFLLLYLKDQWYQLVARWENFKLRVTSIITIVSMHAVSNPRVFYVHASVSVFVFALTGSLFYLAAVWYPVAMLGGSLGYG